MDMDTNQDFNLEDILKEFSEHPEENHTSGSTMPELQFSRDPEPEADLPEISLSPSSEDDLPEFTFSSSLTGSAEASPEEASAEASEEPAASLAEEISVSEHNTDTISFQPMIHLEETDPIVSEDPTVSLDLPETEAPQPPKAEPAFDVEDTFIPSPIVFTPRSRLKELKKQLVAGPERRYYELSEAGTGRLQAAILMNLLVVLICAGVTAMFALDMIPENRMKLVIFSQILAMLVSALLGCNLMLDSLGDLFKGRFTINTLLTLTFAACMADSVFCLQELRVPCCAAFSLEMTMALWARLQRHNTEMAQMDTMRKAVRLHGIVRTENYFEGQDGLLRKEGEVSDFMDTYQKMPAPEVMQCVYAALSLLVCAGIAVFAALLHGISLGVQILSTSMLIAVPATAFIAVSRPAAILETRLHMVGTVLCGWEGVKDLCGKLVFPITDLDLFPQGSTKLNGVKFYGHHDPDEVVSCTASVIKVAGGGLVPVFDQLLKSRSDVYRSVENFRNYGDGGIGAEINGLPVLVGTMQFLQDMGVSIPEGTMVNQAVYTAVDGELSAIYAISYAKMRSAAAGLVTLCAQRKLKPLKLSGDFMLTEGFLRSKFNVKTKRITFPDRDTCLSLQAHRVDPNEPVLAMTTREELVSAAYAVSGARALRLATKLGVAIHMVGGILGLVIMLILGYLGSTELLTPANILLYQLIWGIPGLLVTEWTRVV